MAGAGWQGEPFRNVEAELAQQRDAAQAWLVISSTRLAQAVLPELKLAQPVSTWLQRTASHFPSFSLHSLPSHTLCARVRISAHPQSMPYSLL